MIGAIRHRTSRSVAFWTLAASTLVLQVITTVLTTRLSTTILSTTEIHSVSLSASGLSICVVAALLIRLALSLYRHANGVLIVLNAAFIALSLATAVLTIYTFGWALHNNSHAEGLASTGLVFWTLAVTSQTALYITLLRPSRSLGEGPVDEPMAQRSPPRDGKRSLSVHLTSFTPTKPPFARFGSPTPSPKDSGFTLTPQSSIRDSVNQALRPMGSKTRLLLRNSFASADSPSVQSARPTSFDTVHRHDGFENWDTSAVEDVAASPCNQKAARSRLETIPGSRPVSPARPLDGPFLGGPPPPQAKEVPIPDSPSHSPVTSPGSETSSIVAFPLPPPRRPSTSQSHIHPLFRPESPVPPPIPSPGTVIIASPFAGQVVSAEQALSPGALSPTQSGQPGSLSRPGSSRSLRVYTSTSVEPPLPSPLRKG